MGQVITLATPPPAHPANRGVLAAGECRPAERALRTALLSAQDAGFALGPLSGLSDWFVEVRSMFSRRRAPTVAGRPAAAVH
jgi:hypothetical protein